MLLNRWYLPAGEMISSLIGYHREAAGSAAHAGPVTPDFRQATAVE
ncbi:MULTISPECIES: hypothetical protein [Arthrobacter]|uniref:Uncharacterized protein n=2 Tax=Arthrobacter TaxID=1663 RepID=A0ABU9KN67_9MICC|nr:hypothetical protein [Arthrobacter sp. YJM1]MDP5228352.1 hypothetical protein [Arthrobacter sp. YJM1]